MLILLISFGGYRAYQYFKKDPFEKFAYSKVMCMSAEEGVVIHLAGRSLKEDSYLIKVYVNIVVEDGSVAEGGGEVLILRESIDSENLRAVQVPCPSDFVPADGETLPNLDKE